MLVILHQETSSPGRVGMMLQDMGYALDMRRPPLGQPLPGTLADHEGAVIFGGPMSANDPDELAVVVPASLGGSVRLARRSGVE